MHPGQADILARLLADMAAARAKILARLLAGMAAARAKILVRRLAGMAAARAKILVRLPAGMTAARAKILVRLLAGMAAAAGAAASMALLRWTLQVRTVPERLLEAALLVAPPGLFEAALQRFGFDAKRYALAA